MSEPIETHDDQDSPQVDDARRAYVAPVLEQHDDWHLVTGQGAPS